MNCGWRIKIPMTYVCNGFSTSTIQNNHLAWIQDTTTELTWCKKKEWRFKVHAKLTKVHNILPPSLCWTGWLFNINTTNKSNNSQSVTQQSVSYTIKKSLASIAAARWGCLPCKVLVPLTWECWPLAWWVDDGKLSQHLWVSTQAESQLSFLLESQTQDDTNAVEVASVL